MGYHDTILLGDIDERGSMLLSLPDHVLKEIIEKANEIAEKSYPDMPRFFFERRRIRNEYIGAEIMARISGEDI